MRATYIVLTLSLFACAADEPIGSSSQGAGKKTTTISTPTLTVVGATATSISIAVCAGATGLPAGFSVQWMDASTFTGWPVDSDTAPDLCKASLGGNANLSRFALAPYACTTVDIGRLFDEEPGVSFTCDELTCGTQYVFRAFGHATSTLYRSPFTADLYASTLPCEGGGCTLTQGYWKTHNPLVCALDPASPLCVQWPLDPVTLGVVDYAVAEMVQVFETPAQGNGLVALAHQLAAAKLNIANGADGSVVAAAIAAADALIGARVSPSVGTGYIKPADTSALTGELANYNEGLTGPGHCQ